MESRNTVLALFLFLIIGAAFVGVESVAQPIEYIESDLDCSDYTRDADNDGLYGFIEDDECLQYPYEDGNGESQTPIQNGGQSTNYQPYFDLTVDWVRNLIKIECNDNLAGCIGSNFIYESQFYCWFSDIHMSQNFGVVFSNFFSTSPNFYGMNNDGSSQMYLNICGQLSAPTGDLPTIEHQNTTPIPENPGGSSRGDGGGSSPR